MIWPGLQITLNEYYIQKQKDNGQHFFLKKAKAASNITEDIQNKQ